MKTCTVCGAPRSSRPLVFVRSDGTTERLNISPTLFNKVLCEFCADSLVSQYRARVQQDGRQEAVRKMRGGA